MFLAGTDANTIVSKHIIVNMLELLILNALDNSSIGNDAKLIHGI